MLAVVEGGFGLIGGLLCLACMAGCGRMAFHAIRGLTHRASKEEVDSRGDEAARPRQERDGYPEVVSHLTQGSQTS
jgi:hypothetical protein